MQPVEQQFPGEPYFPQYATPFQQLFDSHSAYSLDDVHSFINKKWEGTGGDSGIAGEGNPPLESGESSDQISSVEGVDSTPAPLAGNLLATTSPLPPAGNPAAVTPLLQAGKPTAATPLLPAGKPAAAPPLLPAGNPALEDIQLSELSGYSLPQWKAQTDRSLSSVTQRNGNPSQSVSGNISSSEKVDPSPASQHCLSRLGTGTSPSPSGNPPVEDFFSVVHINQPCFGGYSNISV